MFKNLRFAAISWLFAGLMLVICLVLMASGYLVMQKSADAEHSWHQLQSEYSVKTRLLSWLVAELGYGEMIHAYKNYQLRNGAEDLQQFNKSLNILFKIIHQYQLVPLTEEEKAALDDIKRVLQDYADSVSESSGHEKKFQHTVDDERLVWAVSLLREQVDPASVVFSSDNRVGLLMQLKRHIGFGGMIHRYKDLIMAPDETLRADVEADIAKAKITLQEYSTLDLNRNESIAVQDILVILNEYQASLTAIGKLKAENRSARSIDEVVFIDEHHLIRELDVLDRYSYRQYNQAVGKMGEAVEVIKHQTSYVMWFAIFAVVIIAIFIYRLMRFHVIRPVQHLAANMTKLAEGNFNIDVNYVLNNNEIGDMARSVRQLKQVTEKYHESEEYLRNANDAITKQIQDIHLWRKKANEQTEQALELARGLSLAREAAEKATERAERDENRIRLILDTVKDAIVTSNESGIIETFNPGAEKMFGYFSHEVIGKNVSILMPAADRAQHDHFIRAFMGGHAGRAPNIPVEQIAQRKNGETFQVEISLNTMKDNGKMKVTALMRDVTERIKRDEEIKRLAMTDPLTGLANRNQYNSRLQDAVKLAERSKKYFALLQIDLDKFKPLNDTYGHPFGDKVLVHIADVLKHACREVDTVARIGGDEFSIILLDVDNIEDVQIPIDRIMKKIQYPVIIDDVEVTLGLSIGVACYGIDSTELPVLIRMADKALYSAKERPESSYQYYKYLKQD